MHAYSRTGEDMRVLIILIVILGLLLEYGIQNDIAAHVLPIPLLHVTAFIIIPNISSLKK